ncbi:hypothetical protein AURDEDRAFT_167688 [Auricularia subglabra TFB-10046 SS5]|nr:hypothetical protein AURDEDRAFT_167688 [Auricularia subglabra TFB-10046 SS5]
MDVVCAPRLSDLSIPERAVVAFSIDPVACVARLKDPVASAAAALIPRRKYLAIVGMVINVDFHKPPNRQPLTHKFHCVARHLPDPGYACLALAPEYASVIPLNRPPLLPVPPLPWADCCVHTLNTFSAQITAIHLTNVETISKITEAEMERLLAAWAEDVESGCSSTPVPLDAVPQDQRDVEQQTPTDTASSLSHDTARSHDSALLQASVPNSGDRASHSARERDASSAEGSSEGDTDGDGDSDTDSDDDKDEETEEDDDDDSDRFDPDGYSLGEIWLGLSSQDEVGTVPQLVETIERLDEIKAESRRRAMLAALSDQPETTRWAEGVASAGSLETEKVPELSRSSGALETSAPDDGLLAPEDAIEHRFEKVSDNVPLTPRAENVQDQVPARGQEVSDGKADSAKVIAAAGSETRRVRLDKLVHYVRKRVERAAAKVSRRVKKFARYIHK